MPDAEDSAYLPGMTIEELTPDVVSLLKSVLHNPQPIEDCPLLQLLMADQLVKGSPESVHITAFGKRLLASYEAAQE